MRTLSILVFTDATATPTVNAQAFSNEIAEVVVHAPTMEDARALLDRGEELARCAMDNWTPDVPVPAKVTAEDTEQALYTVSPVSEQALDATIAEYEATPAGKLLPRSIELAHERRKKLGHHPSGAEFGYLVAKAHKDAWSGVYDAYDLAYKRGYDAGRRSMKKK